MDFDKLEKAGKKMEKWHNRLFWFFWNIAFLLSLTVSIMGVVLLAEHIEHIQNDVLAAGNDLTIINILMATIPIGLIFNTVFFFYIKFFMGFDWPFKSRDNGGGRKIKHWPKPF